MKKTFRRNLIAASLTMLIAAPAGAEVKVGFLATLSGPTADVGQDQLAGFQLALEELGGKLGGVPARLIVEDDLQKPDAALNGLSKLLERDKVDIVTGLTFSNILMALQVKIAATDVPFVGSVAGPSATAGKLCKPNLFIMSWQSDAPAEAVGKYLTDKGITRVSTLTPNFVGGKDKISGFKRFFKGEIADEIYTPLNQLDFSAELTQVSSSNPQAVYVFYPAGALAVSFTRQYTQAGLNKKFPFYSTNSIDSFTLQGMGEAAVGAISADAWMAGIDNPQSKKFIAAFEKKFDRTPSALAAFSYDAAMKIHAAIASLNGDVSDKKALSAAIKQAPFQSLRGEFQFANNNYPIQNYHLFQVVKDDTGKSVFKPIATNILSNHKDQYAAECPLEG